MSHRFARPVAGTFAAYLAGLAANLVVSILVARTMGPEGAGVIALALVGPNILALLGNLGLPNAISHFIRKDPLGQRRTIDAALPVAVSAGLLLLGVSALATHLLGDRLDASTAAAMMLAGFIIPLEILLQCLMAAFQGREEFTRRNAVLLAYRWLYVAMAMTLVLAVRATPGAVIAAGITAYALTCIIGCGVLYRRLPPAPAKRAPLGPDVRRLLGYAWRTHVSAVLVFVILRADLFFVKALLGESAEVGLYSRAVQVAEVVLYFMLAVESVLYPKISGHAPREAPAAAATLCRRALLAGALLVVLFELASRWLILVPFGDAFAGSIAPLRILLPGALAIGLARTLFSVFYALGRPWIPAAISVAALACVIALDLLWIPRHGIQGAALASLVTYVLMAVAALVLFCSTTGQSPLTFLIPRRSDLTAVGRGLDSHASHQR
jgi:O-antigen/teichoic acid export membrane protein